MRKVKEGERFGKLTAIEKIRRGFWLCRRDCGALRQVTESRLLKRENTTCGSLECSGRNFRRPHAANICWSCQRAAGKLMKTCPWASAFQPVAGWDASPTKKGPYASYKITACPLFIDDRDAAPEPEPVPVGWRSYL